MVLLCIKPVHKNTWLFFLLWGCQHKVTRNIRNKENGPKEQSKSPETNPKEMEVYELPDKELKITIIKNINELKSSMHKQNENFNKKKV